MGLVVHPKKQDERRWDLSKRIIRLSRARDYFQISNACEGVAVPGSIGSAKSSTTIEMWAQAYFEQGFGGLCMGPKANFAEKMESVLSNAGALNRAIFLRRGQHGINLIGAESKAFGEGNGLEENLTDLLFAGAEVVTRNLGSGGNDPFWQLSARQECKHLIVLDQKDKGSVDVRRLLALCRSFPRRPEDLAGDWDENACLATVARVREKYPPGSNYSVDQAIDYVLKTGPGLGEKTMGSISISLEVVLDPYCREVVYNAICRDCEDGGAWKLSDLRDKGLIVVCDYPLKDGYDITGKVIGAALKRAVQKQIERELRSFKGRLNDMRPIAFILDDAGCYANTDDVDFLQTGRESRACALWAFHSLALMRDQFGGTDAALNKVKALLGFFMTIVAHQNDDEETNRYYAGKRGERLEKRTGGGTGESLQVGKKAKPNVNENTNYQFVPAPDLPYWAFTTLKRGGEENGGEAQAIVTMPKLFKASKRRYLKVRLIQEPLFHTDPPQSFMEWRNRWLHRWNHFKGRSVFMWFDTSPRVRIWNGHVPFHRVAGWLFLNPERGKKLLDRWIYFWFDEREIAVYEEQRDEQTR